MVVPVTIVVWREGTEWVSQLLEFEIASCGASPEDAVEEAIDAVCAYLTTLEELGERAAVFARRGIRPSRTPPATWRPTIPADLMERDRAQVWVRTVPLPRQGEHVHA